uniref:Septin-type G domain-containing protein n=1 Tax=Ditylenchus dipsaci TaxID=166011 RepID=A0A915D4T6_9BILA
MTGATDLTRKPSQVVAKNDYVGFANFPNQVFRRCIKNGFEFTLMVVGQSGLGKSTFLNSLFLAEIDDPKQKSTNPILSTVKIEAKTVQLVENDVRLKITFVDTPGFGDMVNNNNCWEPVVQFIESKFSKYLTEETKIERTPTIEDQRVHLCLYFIAPTGHSLKALDIDFMRALQDRVNIVPVIAKADTLTTAEMAQFKQNILNDLKRHDIHLYEFPEPEAIASPDVKDKKNTSHPFAVVGSNHLKNKVRVREYPWGIVEVENMAHNDFVPLRDMIIRNNLIDLIDMTKIVHYENFRVRQMGKKSGIGDSCDPFTQMEQERKAHQKELEEPAALNLDNDEKENKKILEQNEPSWRS